jgi:hypothetical protein
MYPLETDAAELAWPLPRSIAAAGEPILCSSPLVRTHLCSSVFPGGGVCPKLVRREKRNRALSYLRIQQSCSTGPIARKLKDVEVGGDSGTRWRQSNKDCPALRPVCLLIPHVTPTIEAIADGYILAIAVAYGDNSGVWWFDRHHFGGLPR